MEARNLTYEQQQDLESRAPYRKVFLVLLALTLLEYLYFRLMAGGVALLVIGLLCLATIKALLIALYFMHVKFEGKWVLLLIIPTTILAVVLVLGLIPDIGMQPIGDPIEGEVQNVPVVLEPLQPLRA